VRFEVLTAATMKMADVWVLAPCSMVEVCRRFRGACCLQQPRRQPSSEEFVLCKIKCMERRGRAVITPISY
jgi:hypothetical protein